MEKVERFELETVRGYLHRPASAAGDGIVLTHGAGSNCAAPLLVALARALADSGVTVLRCDLPFRQARSKGPPLRGDAARDREGLRRAVMALREIVPSQVYLGGHSYGGRQATILASEDPELAAALLLLSYPLHPPRRPTDLRTAHFPNLRTPAQFIHGTQDPFGTPDEMRAALELIPARKELVLIAGAGHELGKGAAAAVEAFARFTRRDKS